LSLLGDGVKSAKGRSPALRRFASAASLTVALILIAVKFWAWIATGSVALLTSAIDALVDAGASIATFVGVRYAQRPPDKGHRWGHGKGEALAALMQALFLAGAGLVLVVESIRRLIQPEPLEAVAFGLWIIVASTVAAFGLVLLQSRVVRQTGSTAIAADRAHYTSDIVVNLAVLAALALTTITGWQRADPVFALTISGYIFWNARRIADEALRQLLDLELDLEDRARIEQAVLNAPGAHALHDLRTRDAGDRIFVEFHLEVDGSLPVSRGHAIADVAEPAVRELFPNGAEVTVHIEPAGIRDERLDDRVT
jgi:cation diffusion facilitator family transporter